MPKKTAVKVRLAARGDARAAALEALRAKGFEIRHDLPDLDLVTGEVDDTEIDALRGVDGVDGCEPDPSTGLPDGEH